MQILDRKDKVLRNKTVPLVKVLWRNQAVEKATWETETVYDKNIQNCFKFRRRNFHKLEGLLHPRFSVDCCNWRIGCITLSLWKIHRFNNEIYDIVD